MQLYDLPERRHVRVYHGDDGAFVEFDHLDGMYSYCPAFDSEGAPVLTSHSRPGIAHLHIATIIEPFEDGYRIVTNEPTLAI